MIIALMVAGVLQILLAAIHLLFPKRFNWLQEFRQVSLLNRQMMYVHTFFLALFLFGMGLLTCLLPEELLHSKLGKWLDAGLAVFWLCRLYCQFFVYHPSLWKGKTFETGMHVVFILLWTFLTAVYAGAFWVQQG